jgi:hypothetical protein
MNITGNPSQIGVDELQTGAELGHSHTVFQTFRQNLGPNGFVDGGTGVLKNVFKEVNAEKIDLFEIQGFMCGVKIVDSFIIGAELVSHFDCFVFIVKKALYHWINEMEK